MENSEVKGGTEDGDKKQTVGVEKPMKDEWEFDDLEEDDTMDGKQGKTEESADDDEKACNMEGDKNTNRNTGEMEEENGEEIKTPRGQDPKKPEMDVGLEFVSAEEAAKENITEENEDTEEKETRRII